MDFNKKEFLLIDEQTASFVLRSMGFLKDPSDVASYLRLYLSQYLSLFKLYDKIISIGEFSKSRHKNDFVFYRRIFLFEMNLLIFLNNEYCENAVSHEIKLNLDKEKGLIEINIHPVDRALIFNLKAIKLKEFYDIIMSQLKIQKTINIDELNHKNNQERMNFIMQEINSSLVDYYQKVDNTHFDFKK